MARPGQVEFIEDLLEQTGLRREDLEDEAAAWGRYEYLPVDEASELIEWLKERRGWQG